QLFEPEARKPAFEVVRLERDAARYFPEPAGAVVNGIHRRHYSEERLRRANIRRRLFAPYVLLPRLKGHPVRLLAVRVYRDADYPPGHLPGELLAGSEVRGVRAAVSERDAQPLCRADDDVGPLLPGRGQERQAQHVGRDCRERARAVGLRYEFRIVLHCAVRVRVLDERAENAVSEFELLVVSDYDFYSEWLRPR